MHVSLNLQPRFELARTVHTSLGSWTFQIHTSRPANVVIGMFAVGEGKGEANARTCWFQQYTLTSASTSLIYRHEYIDMLLQASMDGPSVMATEKVNTQRKQCPEVPASVCKHPQSAHNCNTCAFLKLPNGFQPTTDNHRLCPIMLDPPLGTGCWPAKKL